MLASGQFGAEDQVRAVEVLGGRVIAQWAVSGRFDAVLAAELPDESAALALTLGATRSGQYVELLHAYDPSVIERAKEAYEQAERAMTQTQGDEES